MKFAVFFVALALVYPIGQRLTKSPKAVEWAAMLLGFLPIFDISFNLVSYETYRGDSRGLEVMLLDFIAATLVVALPRRRTPAPYPIARALYLAACVLSIAFAPNPFFATFSIWKILRMYLFVGAVAHAAESPRLASKILTGLALAVVYETVLVLDQRYLLGLMRVQGTLSHPNSLGMTVNLIFPMAFAMLLAGQGGRLALATVAGAALCVVMSLSRGAMLMYVLAALFVFTVSTAQRSTARKAKIAFAGLMGVFALLVKSLDTIVERFTSAPASSEKARELFEEAAAMMLHDYPLGVGINQFSYVLSHGGYGAAVEIPLGDRDGIVHNIYWLTLAETGYVGLFAYVLLLALPLGCALAGARRHRGDIRADVLLGLAAGLTVTHIQGKAEWIGRQTVMMYLTYTVAGLVFALNAQLVRGRVSR